MPMYDIENPPPSPSIADEPYDPPTSAKGEEAPVQSDRVDEETGDTELKLGILCYPSSSPLLSYFSLTYDRPIYPFKLTQGQ